MGTCSVIVAFIIEKIHFVSVSEIFRIVVGEYIILYVEPLIELLFTSKIKSRSQRVQWIK